MPKSRKRVFSRINPKIMVFGVFQTGYFLGHFSGVFLDRIDYYTRDSSNFSGFIDKTVILTTIRKTGRKPLTVEPYCTLY